MADAPGAQAALTQVKSDLARLQDQIDDLTGKLADLRTQKQALVAIRDDYISYIQFKAAQP